MFRFKVERAAILAATLAALLAGSIAPSSAQQIAVSKDLCGPAVPGGGCVIGGGGSMPLIAPYTSVSYQITLTSNDPGPTDVDLRETLPAGFVPTGTTCGTTLPTGPAPLFFGPVSVPAQGQITCLITGYFNYLPATTNNANNEVTVYAVGDHERPIVVSNQVNASVASPATMPSDVSVVKDAMVIASGNGTTTVHYTITVTNNGPNDVYGLQLQDRGALPATSIPLTVSNLGNEICTVVGSGGSDCFDPIPSTDNSVLTVPSISPVDFLEWSYPSGTTGFLAAGDSIVVEFDVLIEVPVGIACQLVDGGNALINEAHIGFNIPGATTTTFEAVPGNNTSWVSVPIAYEAVIDPNCGQPALQITKTLASGSPAVFAWGDTVTYDITLTNASTQSLTNIQLFDAMNGALGDFIAGGIGTPAFTAEVVGIACLPSICSGTVPSVGPQSVSGYLNAHWMLGTTIPSLGAQSSVTFQISIQFTDPACDSYPDVAEKPVLNFVRGRYGDPTLGDVTLQTAPAVALFEQPAACDFKVTKDINDGSDRIVFGQNVHYTVTYENLNTQPMTIGTMIDTLRLAQPNYAWPLTVHYDYTCTESGGVTGFPVGQTGVLQVVPTSLPQQGVRIIQNLTPVVFPGNSIVTCEVRISVEAPVGAAQCARLGELENAAIMDQSAFYDPNLSWSTTPGFYDAASLPLPQCIDLVVNKSADPLWTTQNGGPVSYQLVITNLGDPIVAADGVTVTDSFAPNVAVVPSTDACLNAAYSSVPAPQVPSCDYAWSSPPPANPSVLAIQTLDHNWSANPHFTSTAPYPAAPGQVCNNAVATLSGMNAEDWYARNPSTWETHRCVPIFDTKDLKVGKLLDIIAPATAPAATSFTVAVNCSLQFSGTTYGLSDTLTFTYPPNPMPAQGVLTIPINSTCTITEQQLPVGPFPDKRCPSGFAAWGAIGYPNAAGPDGTPQSVIVGNNSSNTLLVRNTYECVRDIALETGSLFVGKDVVNNTSADLSGWIFPVTVDCTGQPPVSLDLAAGQYSVIHNMPFGTDCHVTEDWENIELPPAEKACPPGLVPQWQPASYEPPNQIISGEPLAITVHNVLDCVRPEKPVDGTLTVEKKVTNNTAADLSGWTYPVFVSCDGGPEVFPSLTDGQSLVVDHVPFGVDCKVGEDTIVVPPAERACPPPLVPQWTTTVSPSGYLHAGDTATIHNVLDCVQPEKPPIGSLTVWKIVDNQTGVDISTLLYDVEVNCGGTVTWLHLLNGHSDTVNNITAGTTCSVMETAPSPVSMPIGNECFVANMVPSWVSPVGYVPAPSVQINGQAATVYVLNTLQCVPAGDGGTGLTIKKTITSDTMDVTGYQNGDFVVQVSCTNPASLTVVTLTHANGYQASLPNLPSGADCTIVEDLSQNPALPAGQQWVATYPSGNQVTIQGGDQLFLFHNEHVWNAVPPGESELRVVKDFTIHGELDPNHTMTFPVSVSCTDANGAALSGFNPLTVNLNPNFVSYLDSSVPEANYTAWASYSVPTGSTCTISEPGQPAPSTDLAACQWAASGPTYSSFPYAGSEQPGASTTLSVAQQTYELSVLNELNCPPFIIAPVSTPAVRTFTITVTQPEPCTPGKSCTFNADLDNDGKDASAGPLFLSVNLPAALGANGDDAGDWFCASSDMGSLCHTSLEDHASGTPLTLKLPLAIPKRAGAKPEACFKVDMPSDADPRSVARAVQLGLASHGYGLGTIDGLIGPKSRAAIASFAKRSGVTLATGSIEEIYSLLFEAALPKTDAGRGEPICVPIDLVKNAEPVQCPVNQVTPDGGCCETGLAWNGKQCAKPRPRCPADSHATAAGECVCDEGTGGEPGKCEPIQTGPVCPDDSRLVGGECRCLPGTEGRPGRCRVIEEQIEQTPSCPDDSHFDTRRNACVCNAPLQGKPGACVGLPELPTLQLDGPILKLPTIN